MLDSDSQPMSHPSIDISLLYNETHKLAIELQDTKRQLEEKERDAILAAELGK